MTDAGLNDYINDIFFVSYGASDRHGGCPPPSVKDDIITRHRPTRERIIPLKPSICIKTVDLHASS